MILKFEIGSLLRNLIFVFLEGRRPQSTGDEKIKR